MGDIFGNVMDAKNQTAMKEKLTILNDWVFIVGIERSTNIDKFIFAGEPTDKAEGDGEEWEGQIATIKTAISENLTVHKTEIFKKIASVQNDISDSKAKVGMLEEKVDGLQSTSQKKMELLVSMKNKIDKLDKIDKENAAEAEKAKTTGKSSLMNRFTSGLTKTANQNSQLAGPLGGF